MPAMPRHALVSRVVVAAGAALMFVAEAAPAAAHGPVPSAPPTPANLLLGWTFPPLQTLAIMVALVWWAWAVGRVNGAHPQSRVPRRRTIAFAAAMTALAFALLSGIERYDTTLFSMHMVQHLLLMLVAAPLLALAAPITQLLRAASPRVRSRVLLPILHSTPIAMLAHPVVAWLTFAVVL